MNRAAATSITSSIGVNGLHYSLSSKALQPSRATNTSIKAISGQTLVSAHATEPLRGEFKTVAGKIERREINVLELRLVFTIVQQCQVHGERLRELDLAVFSSRQIVNPDRGLGRAFARELGVVFRIPEALHVPLCRQVVFWFGATVLLGTEIHPGMPFRLDRFPGDVPQWFVLSALDQAVGLSIRRSVVLRSCASRGRTSKQR